MVLNVTNFPPDIFIENSIGCVYVWWGERERLRKNGNRTLKSKPIDSIKRGGKMMVLNIQRATNVCLCVKI